jgi:rhodanese-related sulfurtransferase
MMLPSDRSYVLLADVDVIAKTATLLLREAGFDVQGHLDGGLASWTDEGSPDSLPTMTVEELSEGLADLNVVDVRESFEFNYARIAQAVNHPSTGPWASHADLPDGSLAMVCADESRSTFVASAARLLGRDASLVRGGMTAWLDRGFPIEGRLKASGQAFDTPIALL